MFENLQVFENRYEELSEKLYDPQSAGDPALFAALMKESRELEPIVSAYREYRQCEKAIEDAKELLESTDKELRELAQAELRENTERAAELSEEIKLLLLPKDPNDEKNVIVEIRGGTGGEEAALFAYDLYRMYTAYAEGRGWRTEIVSLNETELGGFKEVSFLIDGAGAYSRLKFESGAHRVQRVPVTESSGRHLPTGMVVECQDERSQYKNKDKAMKVLRARLLSKEQEKQSSEVAEARRSQVGSGDRSERIRTYNFPQSRVTDHRIGLTLYKLEEVLAGGLDALIDPLIAADRAEKLRESVS